MHREPYTQHAFGDGLCGSFSVKLYVCIYIIFPINQLLVFEYHSDDRFNIFQFTLCISIGLM